MEYNEIIYFSLEKLSKIFFLDVLCFKYLLSSIRHVLIISIRIFPRAFHERYTIKLLTEQS